MEPEQPLRTAGDQKSRPLLEQAEEVLVALKKTVKDLTFYPTGHPARERSIQVAHGYLDRLLSQSGGSLSLEVSQDSFVVLGERIGKDHPAISAFAHDCFLRQIRTIRLLSGASISELLSFVELFHQEPAEIHGAGGAAAILAERGVRQLQVDALDVSFDVKQDEGNQRAHPEAEPPVATEPDPTIRDAAPPAEQPPPTESPPEAPQATGTHEPPLPRDLEGLLEALTAAETATRYRQVGQALEKLLDTDGAVADLGRTLRVLTTFALDAWHEGKRPEAIRDVAEETVKRLATEARLRVFVNEAAKTGSLHEDDLVFLLVSLSEMTAPILVRSLTESDAPAVRRRIVHLVELMGRQALTVIVEVIDYLTAPEIRQLSGLLGQLSKAEMLPILERLLTHADGWIRREGIRLCAHGGVAETTALLLSALEDPQALVRQAAISVLGAARSAAAIPRLTEIALEPPGRSRDVDEQNAAIAALGATRAPEVAGTLIGLLNRTRWFRRRQTEAIRIAAAQALGTLRSPEGMAALRAATGSGSAAVRRACQLALERCETERAEG
ncbi:MAG: HEAT repeat domain-containing protein [Candidatus Methylomirabilales bacterium]